MNTQKFLRLDSKAKRLRGMLVKAQEHSARALDSMEGKQPEDFAFAEAQVDLADDLLIDAIAKLEILWRLVEADFGGATMP